MADNWLPQQVGDLCAKSPGLFFSNRRVEENSLGLLGWCCLLPMSNCDWTIKLARVDTYTTVPGSVASTLNHQARARMYYMVGCSKTKQHNVIKLSRAYVLYTYFFPQKKVSTIHQPVFFSWFSALFGVKVWGKKSVKGFTSFIGHYSLILHLFRFLSPFCRPLVCLVDYKWTTAKLKT